MKRFAHKLFGKLPLGLFTICLQFGWLVYLAYYVTMASSIVNLIFEMIIISPSTTKWIGYLIL